MAKLKKPSPKFAVVACSGGCRATADCRYGCVGCGVCVSVCPFEAIEINGAGVAEVDKDRCIGCGLCAKACPAGAITVADNLSRIDESVCLSCGQCAVKCPRHAIVDVRGILTPVCW